MTEGGAPLGAPPPAAAVTVSEAPGRHAAWGRRAARGYLITGALALVAMAVETALGHAGAATILAAILAVPWSMLASAFAPPLPAAWPMAAGLALRMFLLALCMLLNAAILAGLAARTERDLRGHDAQ